MRLTVGDEDAMFYEAFINGVKEKYCFYADEEEGIAKMYVCCSLSEFMEKYPDNAFFEFDMDSHPASECIATIKGKVELRRIQC